MDITRHTKKTLVINFWAGPSCGKSTWAAGLFFKLKLAGYNVELLPEYAKELTWREDFDTLNTDQEYVIAKQIRRQRTVLGKVDICITDSPILLGIIYGPHCSDNWRKGIIDTYHTFNNLNIFIERDVDGHVYQIEGRRQNLEQSIAVDDSIKSLLSELNIPYHTIKVNGIETLDELYNLVMNELSLPELEKICYVPISVVEEIHKNLFAFGLKIWQHQKDVGVSGRVSELVVSLLDNTTDLLKKNLGKK